jgi:hypothetical protein
MTALDDSGSAWDQATGFGRTSGRTRVAEIIERLGARRCGRGWIARCPAHHDQGPSLSIAESNEGRLLLKCFAGCSYGAIHLALGDRPWPSRLPRRYRPTRSAEGV